MPPWSCAPHIINQAQSMKRVRDADSVCDQAAQPANASSPTRAPALPATQMSLCTRGTQEQHSRRLVLPSLLLPVVLLKQHLQILDHTSATSQQHSSSQQAQKQEHVSYPWGMLAAPARAQTSEQRCRRG